MDSRHRFATGDDRVSPIAFELAVSSEVEAGVPSGLISVPTGRGYPPEDDPQ